MRSRELDAAADDAAVRPPQSLFDSASATAEEEAPPRQGAPLWVVTFADMITLLLAFFLLILSFSELSTERFRDVSSSLQKSLGPSAAGGLVQAPVAESQLAGNQAAQPLPLPEQLAQDLAHLQRELSTDIAGGRVQLRADNGRLLIRLPAREDGLLPQQLIDLYAQIAELQSQVETPVEVREGGGEDRALELAQQIRQLREVLAKEIEQGDAQVERDGERILIRMAVQGSFYPASADLAPESLPLLRKIGAAIAKTGGRITIEGHTDALPLVAHGRFRSNWDLSGARAASVADYLTGYANVPRERVVVRGMADTRPVAPNDSREGRAKNRRIEVQVDAYGG